MYKPNDNLTILLKEHSWDAEHGIWYGNKKVFNEKERWILLGHYKPESQPYYETRKWYFVKHISGLYSVVFADGDLRLSVKHASVKQAYKNVNRIVRKLHSKGLQS